MPLQAHISLSSPPLVLLPPSSGRLWLCSHSWWCRSAASTVSTAAYQEEKTLTTSIILALTAMWFFFWTQSGEIKKATAAEIHIQGSCYNGWYHPKYLKQRRLCSLFSVRCLWRCPQWTGCPWSAVEEPWYAQLPGKEKVCAISKVLSCYRVSSVTSRNQGHSSGSHRLRLLRRNFLLCCFWNIYCLDQTFPDLTSEAMGGHIHPENVSTVPDLDFEHPISQSIKSLQHYYF